MKQFLQRAASLCLCFVLIAAAFLVFPVVEAEAASSLTCADFISNTEHRIYIDTMMQYYIDNNTSLQNALQNGKSVIFMFEGGSDNFPSHAYAEDPSNIRDQAVCIVVQRVSGTNKIVFSSEYCSSFPSLPSDTSGGDYDRQTTLMDGIYSVQTVNHQGDYGALWTDAWQGYYTPPANPNGAVKGASGINIHTRSSGAAGYSASWGCQLIGYGAGSGNSFNTFMRVVTGINQDVYTETKNPYSSSNLYKNVGYYVLDRQLALEGMEGMYTKTAISNITAASRAARENAVFADQHVEETYSSCGTVSVNSGATIHDMPCGKTVDSASQILETATASSYDVVGLCKNDQNEFWYEVKLKTGNGSGYLFAGDTSSFASRNDITISNDATLPEQINQGRAYPVAGTVSTEYAKLDSVDVKVTDFGQTERLTGGTATNVNSKLVDLRSTRLSISGSNQTLDDTVVFNKLSIGNHTMHVIATTKIYYVEAATLKQTTETSTKAIHFSTVDGTCTHSYATETTVAATCTTGGYTKHVCSKCNSSYLTAFTTSGQHEYAEATCCAPETCIHCGDKRGYVNSENHSFGAWLSNAGGHWQTCACGASTTPAPHDYRNGDTCAVCNHQKVASSSAQQTTNTQPQSSNTPQMSDTQQNPDTSNTNNTSNPINAKAVGIAAASVGGVGLVGTTGFIFIRKRRYR